MAEVYQRPCDFAWAKEDGFHKWKRPLERPVVAWVRVTPRQQNELVMHAGVKK